MEQIGNEEGAKSKATAGDHPLPPPNSLARVGDKHGVYETRGPQLLSWKWFAPQVSNLLGQPQRGKPRKRRVLGASRGDKDVIK